MLIYATLDAEGQPVALPAGAPFTTYRQLVENDQEAAWTMLQVGSVADVEVTHSATALGTYGTDDLARYDIQPVTVGDPPEGQVLDSYGLAVDGFGHISATPVFVPAPTPPVPSQVSAMQLRRAMNALGLRDAVEAAVAGSGDQDLKDYWQYTAEFHRDHPKVALMVTAVGKTDADADALWTLAGTLS